MFNIEHARRMPSAGAGGSNDPLPGPEAMQTDGFDPTEDKEDELADLEEEEGLVFEHEDEDGPSEEEAEEAEEAATGGQGFNEPAPPRAGSTP